MLQIESLGAGGDGIAILDGARVFVPGTLPGDTVEVRPAGASGGEGRQAALLRVVQPSADRVEPPCRHAARCGGCALQHVAPPVLADWKRRKVATALGHRGLAGTHLLPGLEGGPGRRRRVAWSARTDRKGHLLFGFHARRSRDLVDIGVCPLLEPALEALIRPLRALLPRILPVRSEARIIASLTDGGIDMLIEAPVASSATIFAELADFADRHDLARLTLTHDNLPIPVARRRPADLRWPYLVVEPPPGGFLQADRLIEAQMQQRVAALAAGASRVADLFCGCGTLTAALDPETPVLALDSDAHAIAALRDGVNRQPGRRIEAAPRDLFRRPLRRDELAGFDLVLLDPPAAGARAQADEIAASPVPLVGYLSCDPATFARDARILVDGGYALESVEPMDQFHWSADIELFAVFRRAPGAAAAKAGLSGSRPSGRR